MADAAERKDLAWETNGPLGGCTQFLSSPGLPGSSHRLGGQRPPDCMQAREASGGHQAPRLGGEGLRATEQDLLGP